MARGVLWDGNLLISFQTHLLLTTHSVRPDSRFGGYRSSLSHLLGQQIMAWAPNPVYGHEPLASLELMSFDAWN